MLNNPLGTYAENGQIIGTSTNCNCIRYSLLVPALAAAYVVALTRSTIALEKRYTLPLHLLEVLFVMYF